MKVQAFPLKKKGKNSIDTDRKFELVILTSRPTSKI